MTSLAAVAPVTAHVPLSVAVVESRGRLLRIYAELKAWQAHANNHELGRESLDFSSAPRIEKRSASDYYNIAQKTAELIGAKLGNYDDATNEKFKNHKIIAAYDADGHLQGVAAVKIVGKKGVAAKIDYLVTAFWNMPFSSPLRDFRTRGAGTCIVSRIAQIVETTGAIFVEPTFGARPFYQKRQFTLIKDWEPKTAGAVCGMALYASAFESVHKLASEQMISAEESTLPTTQLHDLAVLPREWGKTILSSKEIPDNKESSS